MKKILILLVIILSYNAFSQPAKIDKTNWVVVEKKGPIETDIWGYFYGKNERTGKIDSFIYKNISVNSQKSLIINNWYDRMDELRMMKARYQNKPMYLMVDKSLFFWDEERGLETRLTTLSFDSLTYKEMVNYINSNDTTLKYFKILGDDTETKKSVEKKNAVVDDFLYKPEEFNLAYYAGNLENFPIAKYGGNDIILLKNDGKYIHFCRLTSLKSSYINWFNKTHFYMDKEKFKKMFVID